ncbi:MAG TPA: hypothetical protein VMF06_11480, partial [Candidatus Limnocylindria bacterium]|nr:hypothetical protein [Candidatus Limnocylindria bacterium]
VPDGAASLSLWIKELHSKTARWLNQLDKTPVRSVWYNYWETLLTHQHSYFVRLKYVHENPVKHGLVNRASLYRWGSAGWFERTVSPAQYQTIHRCQTGSVRVHDDYEPSPVASP